MTPARGRFRPEHSRAGGAERFRSQRRGSKLKYGTSQINKSASSSFSLLPRTKNKKHANEPRSLMLRGKINSQITPPRLRFWSTTFFETERTESKCCDKAEPARDTQRQNTKNQHPVAPLHYQCMATSEMNHCRTLGTLSRHLTQIPWFSITSTRIKLPKQFRNFDKNETTCGKQNALIQLEQSQTDATWPKTRSGQAVTNLRYL